MSSILLAYSFYLIYPRLYTIIGIIGEIKLKFKFIFILLSITLLLFLAILVFLPNFMLGPSFSASFWRYNWPFIVLWGLIFTGFNVFYFTNRRLFLLLEKEDWPALVRYLEDRVIQKGRYSARLVRLLANSYLVLSDSAAVMSLENKTAIVKPALINANALVFGTARILGKDISGALRFFESKRNTVKADLREWVNWYYGFTLLLNRQFDESADNFTLLARTSKDAIITALSSYFLSENIARVLTEKGPELQKIASEGRDRVRKVLPEISNWNREVTRLSTEIHAAALSKYMEETGQWLY